MSLLRSRFVAPIGVVFLAALCALVILGQFPRPAEADPTTPLKGYAWSDTVGWISVNCAQTGNNTCSTSTYGITMNANGTLSGWAWSDAIGWISANESTGCPSGTCTPSVQNGQLTGWLRACAGRNDVTSSPTNQSVPNNTCTGWTRTDGWDGWISLAGTNGSITWSITYNSTTGFFGNITVPSENYAWGSEVVGWVDFSQVQTATLCQALTYCKTSTQVCQRVPDTIDPTICTETCAICEYGSCVGNACYFPSPNGNITAVPSIVAQGNTVVVSWNAENVRNCTVTGDNSDGPWNQGAGADDIVTGSNTSSAIQKQTVYTLDCLELDDQNHFIDDVTVNLVPGFIEK